MLVYSLFWILFVILLFQIQLKQLAPQLVAILIIILIHGFIQMMELPGTQLQTVILIRIKRMN